MRHSRLDKVKRDLNNDALFNKYENDVNDILYCLDQLSNEQEIDQNVNMILKKGLEHKWTNIPALLIAPSLNRIITSNLSIHNLVNEAASSSKWKTRFNTLVAIQSLPANATKKSLLIKFLNDRSSIVRNKACDIATQEFPIELRKEIIRSIKSLNENDRSFHKRILEARTNGYCFYKSSDNSSMIMMVVEKDGLAEITISSNEYEKKGQSNIYNDYKNPRTNNSY